MSDDFVTRINEIIAMDNLRNGPQQNFVYVYLKHREGCKCSFRGITEHVVWEYCYSGKCTWCDGKGNQTKWFCDDYWPHLHGK